MSNDNITLFPTKEAREPGQHFYTVYFLDASGNEEKQTHFGGIIFGDEYLIIAESETSFLLTIPTSRLLRVEKVLEDNAQASH